MTFQESHYSVQCSQNSEIGNSIISAGSHCHNWPHFLASICPAWGEAAEESLRTGFSPKHVLSWRQRLFPGRRSLRTGRRLPARQPLTRGRTAVLAACCRGLFPWLLGPGKGSHRTPCRLRAQPSHRGLFPRAHASRPQQLSASCSFLSPGDIFSGFGGHTVPGESRPQDASQP